MLEKWVSRKLVVALAGIATASQVDTWTAAVVAGVAVVYVIAQAYVDAVGAANTKVDEGIDIVKRVIGAVVEGVDKGKAANG